LRRKITTTKSGNLAGDTHQESKMTFVLFAAAAGLSLVFAVRRKAQPIAVKSEAFSQQRHS
tara:strand:- start:982 stop:1164 length:183 start_codon:yes stop_codon:yes gene_type:complete